MEHDTPLVAALAQVDDLAGPATLGSLLPDVGPAASGWVLGVTANCEDEVGAREVGINRPRIIMLYGSKVSGWEICTFCVTFCHFSS